MKNKKIVYVLLPLVIVVWSLIILRILDYSKEENDSLKIEQKKIFLPHEKEEPFVFELVLNYPDPFLKTYVRKVKGSSAAQGGDDDFRSSEEYEEVSEKPKHSPNEEMPKPKKRGVKGVFYMGLMQNQTHHRKVGFFTVQNKYVLLEEGDHLGAFHIQQIWEDSARISYDKNDFIILRDALNKETS